MSLIQSGILRRSHAQRLRFAICDCRSVALLVNVSAGRASWQCLELCVVISMNVASNVAR